MCLPGSQKIEHVRPNLHAVTKRNNEKRKEKSRVAARCRRNREMQIFAELTSAIPAKKEELEQLDKASVMRLAISYLRVRDVVSLLPTVELGLPSVKKTEELTSELSLMKALDGFVLVLAHQGDIVFCSENVADHLGVSQMEIMGQSVYEFSHPCDHDEIRDALRHNGNKRRELLVRLKCTLTNKGRNVHLKSASYKVIHITGHMLSEDLKNDDKKEAKESNASTLVAVGRPIQHPANIEIPLDSKTFLTQHSLDMKFTYNDALMKSLGFEPNELVGSSLYDYHHAGDSAALAQQFKCLFSKGQCETGQYRFLAKSGGYVWVQTQATLITDKQQKPLNVVCVNYIISGIECKDEVFAAHQLEHSDLKPAVVPTISPVATPILPRVTPFIDIPNGAIVGTVLPEEEKPIPVTDLIFAPLAKKDMYAQDEALTMLHDEPDLTHLAPTPGDACIPLENDSFYMIDDLLNDSYYNLLGDDLGSGSPVESLLLSSPDHQESDSSCEQSSLLTELSIDAFDNTKSDLDDGTSPFIPPNDDIPGLESVMWGALPDNVCLAKPQPSDKQSVSTAPALERLLAAPPTGPPPQDLIKNIYSDQALMPSKSMPSWDAGVKRVMTPEDETNAKRVKRSPSPVQKDMPLQQANTKPPPSHQQLLIQLQKLPIQIPNKAIPLPYTIIQTVPNKQILRTKAGVANNNLPRITNPMSPLSLNIGSPMYSLPSSPSYSPAMSPNQKERIINPYTPQLSPSGKHVYSPGKKQAGMSPGLSPCMSPVMAGDPYMINKMQPSPNYSLQTPDGFSSSSASPDWSWSDTDVGQGTTADLLTSFGDVKLESE